MLEIVVFWAVAGLIIGSFIGALTWRFPRHMTMTGRSRCPKCQKQLRWYDNIPLVSYLWLFGRCRFCRGKISLRYPLIEAVTALIFVAVARHFLTTPLLIVIYLVISCLLLIIAIIDWEHYLVPDRFVGWLVVVGLVMVMFSPSPALFIDALWAAAAATIMLLINVATKGAGMGLGDAKLAAALGLVSGSVTPLVLFLGVLSGAVIGVGLVILGRAKLGRPIPFGPFLIFGFFIALLYKELLLPLFLVV